MDSVLSLILLVSEMLKIQRAKVEVYFLKKFILQPTNVWRKMPSENVQRQQKTFQNTQQYASSYVHKFSYYLLYSTNLS